ncbi:MAG: hypothetical protein K9G76_05060 [Bacteroidales bacterium]|nr:hypothetical protein [Bacteroidales bacterium]MCF8403049.1 hypothetical protein [Bacteroidales bacterium]
MMVLTAYSIFKLLQVFLVSAIKFMFAPILSIGYGFNYFQTVLLTTVGGISGILFLNFLSKWLIALYDKYCPIVYRYFASEAQQAKLINGKCKKEPRKKFTRRNKSIISLRTKYGFIGIILLTPVLLSIPIGTFLAQKYYSKKNNVLVYLSISVLFWSFAISTVYFLF